VLRFQFTDGYSLVCTVFMLLLCLTGLPA